MPLTKEDIATISRTVVETLDSRRGVSEEQHHEDHDWLTRFRDKAEKKAAMWNTIKTRAIGWAVILALTGVVTGTWWALKEFWKQAQKINGG